MTGKVAHLSNYPNGFDGGLALDGLSTHRTHAGRVYHVAGGSAGSRSFPNAKSPSDGNKGTFLAPFKTLGYAVEQATQPGDVIVCHPGMIDEVETVIDFEVAGVTVLGLGNGDSRPQLTPGVADSLDIESDNITIQNMYFNEADAEIVSSIDVVGAGFRFVGNHMDLGAHDDTPLTLTATAERPTVLGNEFVVTADGTESVVKVEGVIDRLYVDENLVVSSVAAFDDGFIDAEAVAITNAFLGDENVFLGGGTKLVATGDVGTVNELAGNGPLEMTTVAAEFIESAEATLSAPVINGNVDIHGIFFIITAGMDTGDDLAVATESGVTLVTSTEVAAASAAGDRMYAAAPGGALTVDEVGTAETLLWSTPLAIRGAADSEDAIDVTATGTGEADGVYHIVWSSADGVGEVAAS